MRKHHSDAYKAARKATRRARRSGKMLKRNLLRKLLARNKKNAKKLEKAKAKLLKKKAEAKLKAKNDLALGKALKMRATLNKIEAEKNKIAEALLTKQRIEREAIEADRRAQAEAEAAERERRRIAREQLRFMREKENVQKLKLEVARLAEKARGLHSKLIDIREGGKPITTNNVLEDGLGNGRLEDGYSRHVPIPDRQTQKALDYAVGEVMGEALKHGKELRQHIIEGSFPIMNGADTMREKFQDFRIEMTEERATPEGWPSVVHEAEEIKN